METIRTYLDNMFMNLPKTVEVYRAKTELLNMMEDKYNELKSEGKSENEAIGVVISEFGNLNELAQELGIKDYVYHGDDNQYSQQQNGDQQQYSGHRQNDRQQQYSSQQQYDGQQYQNDQSYQNGYQRGHNKSINIDITVAKEYITVTKLNSIRIAIGVFLCICSPIALIILGGLSEYKNVVSDQVAGGIGLLLLLCMIAVAVGLFIFSGTSLDSYNYLKKDILMLEQNAEDYVSKLKFNGRQMFATKITVGVLLCIFSVIPLVVCAIMFESEDMLLIWCVGLLLVIVAVAVFLFITAGMELDAYKVLLQEEEYNKMKKSNKVMDTVSSIYWSIITCIYLGYSFITFNWGRSWIIWPVAGVLFGAIAAIVSACTAGNDQ